MDTRPVLRATPTEVTPRSAEMVRLPNGGAVITGTPGEVGQMLARLDHSGRLVSATMPAPTGVPGQVLVNVRLATSPPRQRVAAPRPAPVRRRLPRWAKTAVAAGAVAAVACTGWLLMTVLRAIVENAALLVGLLALAAVGLGVAARVGRGRTFSGTFQGGMD